MKQQKVIAEWDASEGLWLVMWPSGWVATEKSPEDVLAAVMRRSKVKAKEGSVLSIIRWQNVPKGFEEPKVTT